MTIPTTEEATSHSKVFESKTSEAIEMQSTHKEKEGGTKYHDRFRKEGNS